MNTTHTPTMVNKLRADSLYIGDNGRVFCRDHAGMTAQYTGRDLSGQYLHRIARTAGFHCESCRAKGTA